MSHHRGCDALTREAEGPSMKGRTMVNRWGAYGAYIAGFSLVIGHVWAYMGGVNANSATLLLLAHALIFFVLFALYERIEGSLADYGTALAVVGNAVVCGVIYGYLAVGDGAMQPAALESGMLGTVGLAGISLFTLGLVLIGVAIVQHATLPSPLGGMFVAAAVLTYVGGFTTEIVFVVGAVIAGLATLWVGALLNETADEREAITV
jgi:hypothetical protein